MLIFFSADVIDVSYMTYDVGKVFGGQFFCGQYYCY